MKFKIIGNKKINGKEPGELVEIKDEQMAQALIAGGHIKDEKIKHKKGAKNA